MNDLLKQKTLGLFVKTGGALSRLLLNHEGLIFCFHRIMEQREEGELFGASRLSNTLVQLEQCITFFRKKGYALLSMDEVYENLHAKRGSKKFVAFTFDDGYLDNYTNLLPLMQAEDVPFMVYVTTGLIEGGLDLWWYTAEEIIASNTHLVLPQGNVACTTREEKQAAFNTIRQWLISSRSQEELQVKILALAKQEQPAKKVFDRQAMNWKQVKAISESKQGAIGAHTVHHLALANLPEEAMLWELTESKRVLEEKTGSTVNHFAYPYGTTAEAYMREYKAAQKAGFKTAVTLRPGAIFASAAQQPMALPRVYISNRNIEERLCEMENGIFHFRNNGFNKLIYA